MYLHCAPSLYTQLYWCVYIYRYTHRATNSSWWTDLQYLLPYSKASHRGNPWAQNISTGLSLRLRKETKGKGEGKRKKRINQPRNFCIKFVAFDKRCQCCEGDSEESCRSQGFDSELIAKLRRQDECSATASISSPRATGVPPGETWGKGK